MTRLTVALSSPASLEEISRPRQQTLGRERLIDILYHINVMNRNTMGSIDGKMRRARLRWLGIWRNTDEYIGSECEWKSKHRKIKTKVERCNARGHERDVF